MATERQEYWLVTFPRQGADNRAIMEKIKAALSGGSKPLGGLSYFDVPDLRVGTLDTLMVSIRFEWASACGFQPGVPGIDAE